MQLTPAWMHAANLRLLENVDGLSPNALNFPCPVAIPVWGRREQEAVSLCPVLLWCLFVLSLLALSAALVLLSCYPSSFLPFWLQGWEPELTGKASFTLFLLCMNPRLHLKRWKVP